MQNFLFKRFLDEWKGAIYSFHVQYVAGLFIYIYYFAGQRGFMFVSHPFFSTKIVIYILFVHWLNQIFIFISNVYI